MHKSDKFSPRLVRGTGAAIIFALSGMTMARAQDMKPYHDKKFGFQIACPEGWEVKADAKRILVRSQDHTSFAVIENFVPAGDETAEDHIQSLPRTEGDLLRRAVVKSAGAVPPGKNAPSGSGQAAGRIGYWGERGAGEAVVLCQVAPQGGLLFGIGATKDRLDQERPELIRILQSLRFDAPSPREKGGRGKEPVRVTAEPGGPQYEDTLSVRYIHWSDPQFKGFSTEVPQGWTVEGGTSRADVLDTRQSVQARSPHGEMAVMLGDNGLPGQFSILDGFAQSRGMHDGSTEKRGVVTTTYLHYMSPEEFNHWYLQNVLSRAIGGLEIGSYQEESDLARQVQGGVSGPVGVEAGATRFTWQDKKTGSHLSGLLSTIIRRFGSNGQGTWTPRPRVILWADGDGKAEAREKTVRAVFAHMTGPIKSMRNLSRTRSSASIPL